MRQWCVTLCVKIPLWAVAVGNGKWKVKSDMSHPYGHQHGDEARIFLKTAELAYYPTQ